MYVGLVRPVGRGDLDRARRELSDSDDSGEQEKSRADEARRVS